MTRRDMLTLIGVLLLVWLQPATASNSIAPVSSTDSRCGNPPNLVAPRTVTISPDGSHAYVTGGQGRLLVFERDSITGVLTYLEEVRNGEGGVTDFVSPWGSVVSPDGAHVYVSDFVSDRLFVFDRDGGTGALTFLQAMSDGIDGVEGLNGAQAVAISPDGKHVYVAGSLDDALAVFSRDVATGLLTFVEAQIDGVSGVDGLLKPTDVMVSPDGAHVYATAVSEDEVSVFSRDGSTGALTFVEVQQHGVGGVTELRAPYSLDASPDGLFVYVSTNSPLHSIAVFARNPATGSLSFVESFETDFGSSAATLELDVSPDGAHVYVSTLFGDRMVVLERDATFGTLSFLQAFAYYLYTHGIRSAVVSPDGAHVYGVSGSEDAVTSFARNASTGLLTLVDAVLDQGKPVTVAVSSDGTSVYGVCARRIGVSARDGGTGVLTLTSQLDLPLVGPGITSFALSDDGAHAYATQQRAFGQGDLLLVLARDPLTGSLSLLEQHEDEVAGVDGLSAPSAVSVSPDDEHVYVAGAGDDSIAIFDRDVTTGLLTFVAEFAHPLPGTDATTDIASMAFSPDGLYLYSVTRDSPAAGVDEGHVAVFARDPATGLLTFVEILRDGGGGSPSTLFGASDVVVSDEGTFVYVAAENDHAITVFRRDPVAGTLEEVQVEKDPSGSVYGFSTLSPSASGEFLYANTGQLVVYRRDAGTGRVSFVQTVSPQLIGLTDIAESPDGEHIYALADAGIVGYARVAACTSAPMGGCLPPENSTAKLTVDSASIKNKVAWKWRGPAIAAGDPSATTDLALCLYDGSGGQQPVIDAVVPAAGTCGTKPCWQAIAPGFKYKDRSGTPDGILKAKLLVGGSKPARVAIKGKGGALPPLGLPLTDPVTVQVQLSNGTCLEATYPAALVNDGFRYTGKVK